MADWGADDEVITAAKPQGSGFGDDDATVDQFGDGDELVARNPDVPVIGEFWRGLIGGFVEQNPDMAANALEAYRRTMGLPSEGAEEWLREIAGGERKQYKPAVASLGDIRREAFMADFARWLAGGMGAGIASTVPSLVAGGAGAAVGSLAGPAGTVAGAVGGALAPSLMLNTGDVMGSLVDEGVDRDTAAQAALALSLPISALDLAGLAKVAGVGTSVIKKGMLKILANRIKEGAIGESWTEAAQQSLQEVTAAYLTGNVDLERRALDVVGAGIIGGATGGAMGVGTGAMEAEQARRTVPREGDAKNVRNIPSPPIITGDEGEKAPKEGEIPEIEAKYAPGMRVRAMVDGWDEAETGVVDRVERDEDGTDVIRIVDDKGAQLYYGPLADVDVSQETPAAPSPQAAPEAQAPEPATDVPSAPPPATSDAAAGAEPPAPGDAGARPAGAASAVPGDQPTEAQKQAGNYPKRKETAFPGLEISIETEQGQERTGTGPDGKPWSVTMPAPYGYIRRTEGADGDQVDVYVGPNPAAPTAFVIDQVNLKNRRFDEHKVILGADSEAQALAIYDAGFSDGRGPERRRAVTQLPMDEFKAWLKAGDTKKPLAKKAAAKPAAGAAGAVPVPTDEPAAPPAAIHHAGYGKPKQQQKILQKVRARFPRLKNQLQVKKVGGRWSLVLQGGDAEDNARIAKAVEQATNSAVRRSEAARARGGPKRKGPVGIREALAAAGGVMDPGGELKAMGADQWHVGRPGMRKLIAPPRQDQGDMMGGSRSADGRGPDDRVVWAIDNGYLPPNAIDDVDGGIDRLFQALQRDDVPLDEDVDEQAAASANRAQMEQLAGQLGIDPTGMSDEDLAIELAERVATSDDPIEMGGQVDDVLLDLETDIPGFEREDADEAIDTGAPGEGAAPGESVAGPDVASDRPDEGGEAGAGAPGAGAIDRIAAGDQRVIPGAERISDRELAERRGQQPLRGRVPQDRDLGPLGDLDARGQSDLMDLAGKEARPPIEGSLTPAAQESLPEMTARLDRLGKQMFGQKFTVIGVPELPNGALGRTVPRAGAAPLILIAARRPGDPSAMTTLTHEGIHYLREIGALSDKDWRLLEQEAAAWRERFEIDQRYADLTEEGRNEEAIAEAFAAFVAGERFTPAVDTLFQKIRLFLARAWNAISGMGFRTVDDLFSAIEGGALARLADALAEGDVAQRDAFLHAAYHGTPHDFDSFSLDYMGTGEGAQSYGWGLYFAGKRGVAEYYRDSLSKRKGDPELYRAALSALRDMDNLGFDTPQEAAREIANDPNWRGVWDIDPARSTADAALEKALNDWLGSFEPSGRLYTVDLAPAEDEYLDWDKPISEQSEKVQDALDAALRKSLYRQESIEEFERDWDKMTGEEFYERLAGAIATERMEDQADSGWTGFVQTMNDRARDDRAASIALRDVDIPGIRFFDQDSRRAADPTRQRQQVNQILDFIDSYQREIDRLKRQRQESLDLGAPADHQTIREYDEGIAKNERAIESARQRIDDIASERNLTRNYVIFDDALIKITGKEQRQRQANDARLTRDAGGPQLALDFTQLPPARPQGAVARVNAEARDFVLERGRATGHEYMMTFDAVTGAIISQNTSNAVNYVDMTDEFRDVALQPDRAVISHHNHPSNTALSKNDISLLVFPGIQWVVADGHGGDMSAARMMPDLRAELARMTQTLLQQQNLLMKMIGVVDFSVFKRLHEAVRGGTLPAHVANHIHAALIGRALAGLGMIDYVSTHESPVHYQELAARVLKETIDEAGPRVALWGWKPRPPSSDRYAQPVRADEAMARISGGNAERAPAPAQPARGAAGGPRGPSRAQPQGRLFEQRAPVAPQTVRDYFSNVSQAIERLWKGTPPDRDIIVERPVAVDDLSLWRKYLFTPLAALRRFPAFQRLIYEGEVLVQKRHQLTDRFFKQYAEAVDGLSDKDMADLQDALWAGDAAERELTAAELRAGLTADDGTTLKLSEPAIAAFTEVRRIVQAAGRLVDRHERAMLPNVRRERDRALAEIQRINASARVMSDPEFKRLYARRSYLQRRARRGQGNQADVLAEIDQINQRLGEIRSADPEVQARLEKARAAYDVAEARLSRSKVTTRPGYMPHKFIGSWRVFEIIGHDDEGNPQYKEVTSDQGFYDTREAAVKAAADFKAKKPDAVLLVKRKGIVWPSNLKGTELSDAAYGRLASMIEDVTGLEGAELDEAMQGIARRPTARRFVTFKRERKGYEGWARDMSKVMKLHLAQVAGYVTMDRLKYDYVKLMEREGLSKHKRVSQDRPVLQSMMEAWFRDVNGEKQNVERYIDNWLMDKSAGGMAMGAGALGFLAGAGFTNPVFGVALSGYLGRRMYQAMKHPTEFKTRQFQDMLLTDMAHLKLGAFTNVGSAVVNLMQIALNAYPVLGAKYTAIGLKRGLGGLYDLMRGKDSADARILKRGGIQTNPSISEVHRDLLEEDPWYKKASMFFFSSAEQINRAVTFMGAYQRALDRGQNVTDPLGNTKRGGAAALELARRLVAGTQFDNTLVNRPELLRAAALKLPAQFKNFLAQQIAFFMGLRDMTPGGRGGTRYAAYNPRAWATPEVARFLLAMALTSGMLGLPFLMAFDWMLDYLFDFSPIDQMKRLAIQYGGEGLLGGSIGQVLLRGVPALFGLDLSQRSGMGAGFFPSKPQDFAGPWFGTAKDLNEKVKNHANLGDQLRTLSPGIGAPVQALEAAANGMGAGKLVTDPGAFIDALRNPGTAVTNPLMKGQTEYRPTGTDIGKRALGMRPLREAISADVRDAVKRTIDKAAEKAKPYLRDIADAIRAGQNSDIAKITAKAKDAGVQITPRQVQELSRGVALERNERMLKRVPQGQKQGAMELQRAADKQIRQ